MIIAGDFMNMLVEMSFVSLITEPTLCTDTSSTHIDHIWSNMDRNFHYFFLPRRYRGMDNEYLLYG